MKNINRFIEHTILKPDANQKEIEKIVAEGIKHQFIGVCVPPFWVKSARKLIGNEGPQLVTIAGFPFGYNQTEIKMAEIGQALEDGADEVDIVWNLSAFKSGMPWAKIDIARCAGLLHDHHRILKVIIETACLSDDEISQACEICSDAGADFVKTSTGFASSGAKVEHVRLMRSVLPSHIGIKAAGGIRDYETAADLIRAGADRLGTSSGVGIIQMANSILP
ncbi:MAG: deoxyribose-phosphate aldolase [Cyclobacteriaceae bacterium]|nr:deoxyribose-phosphate aldolase [Cyclobacteriaceae bacterium]